MGAGRNSHRNEGDRTGISVTHPATCIGDMFVRGAFNEAVLKPGIWDEARNLEKIAAIVRDHVPLVMDYLENIAPAEGKAGASPRTPPWLCPGPGKEHCPLHPNSLESCLTRA